MSGTGVCGKRSSPVVKWFSALSLPALFLIGWTATAQISVVTQHNDIARTGANTSETMLMPSNVTTSQFGKLFSHPVDGYVYAQPLYVPGVTIGGATHNVVFVATENDSVYAFDADSNAGATNASPLWHVSLLPSGATAVPASDLHQTDIVPVIGITGTPVIDPAAGTLYVVAKSKESGAYVQRLHALSITSGADKVTPVKLAASVPGNGTGSSSGTLHFDPFWENQRPGLLLLNGRVYIGFSAHQDMGTWHGWILAYNASTLQQTGAWCSTPNGVDGGIWGAGSGLAADVPDPTGHPYGRILTATGNGKYDAVAPNYNNTMDYGDSIVRLDLSGGVPSMVASGKTVGDEFTPLNQSTLDSQDLDQGSGGTLLLPNAASAGQQHLLVQAGKKGIIYVVNQESMGGYHPTNTSDPQQKGTVGGMWSAPAYWNGFLYFWGMSDHLRAFKFNYNTTTGAISLTASSTSAEFSNFPGSTPAVSASGTTNGIVWDVLTASYASQGFEILQAHDALNVSKLLYASTQNQSRDNPGNAVKFVVPTVANGKVYVGAEYQISVYGLLNGMTQAAMPVINPATESFTSSVSMTMSDSTTGAAIHYTTDGSVPTAASPTYTSAITVTSTETIRAIALASGFLDSNVAAATYTKTTTAAMPVFNPGPGTYSSAQQVTITSATSGAIIYYTTDGTTPTTSSTRYSAPVSIGTTETLKAIATASGLSNSAVASGLYTIQSGAPQAARPSFSPAPGTYTSTQNVSLFSTTSGATFYYTTDGTTPTTSSTKYTGPIPVSVTETIKAIATAPNFSPSAVSSAPYTIQGGTTAATPTFSPVAGTYSSTQQVTISSTTSGAIIYYTTDGTTPTTSSTKYGGPVTISTTTTLKAIATATGFTNSAVASGVYTIQSGNPPAATPTFSPVAGTYSTTQQVTISSTTSGATIYYTTDGSTPTTGSTPYTAPVTISTTTTLKAIATATGFTNSAVAGGVYTIQSGNPPAATPTFSPVAGTYSTTQQVTISSTTSGATIYYTTDGSTPTTGSTPYTAPVTISITTTLKAIATATGFTNSAVQSGVYTIQAVTARPSFSPAPGTYTGTQNVSLHSTTAGASFYYTTDGSTPTTSSTLYTGPIPISVTTTLKAIATAPNLAPSSVSSANYVIQ